jgi:formylglycine-generating enzyme required for sulfatase activity
MSVRLPLPDDRLRALFETFQITATESIWKGRIEYCQNLVERATAWDAQALRRHENQRELWESGAVGYLGRGQAVDTTAIYADEEVLARLADLQRAWPSQAEERALDIQRAYDVLLRAITPRLCPTKPAAKLHRVFATLLPWYLHRCFSRPSQKQATHLLLGESRRRPLQNAVLARARLERVLGVQSLAEHVRHSFFCWWLHEQYARILAGEEIEGAQQMASHDAARPGSEARTSPGREAALSSLLVDLFDGDAAGLGQWVRLNLDREIHAELPGGPVSLRQLAFETMLTIQRHGRADASLFGSLRELRPRWAARIGDVARLYGVAREETDAPRPMTGAGPSPASSSLDPLAQRLEAALRRKQKLDAAGLSSESILAEIRELKREHRRGGQLRPGDVLGDRYLLAEQIGRGGFATVWRARDTSCNEDVAIKVLHPELAGDLIRRQRFFRGARIMAELAHPIVVRIRERDGEDDGFYYVVMDLVPGGNLQDAVLEQRVHHGHVASIILSVGEALAEAHARGHVHRDVKPVNILLTESGAPRLTDFDLVTGLDTTGGTRTGALGTFIYAAPEMMERPQDADARADVYALGMTMAFMLHGDRLPWKALTARERFIEGLHATPAVEAVLKQATAENPGERYPDAAAFCRALRAGISPGSAPAEGDRPENAAGSVDDRRDAMQGGPVEMVELSGGIFWMGSEEDDALADENETPMHQVEVSPFECMKYPVTRRLWREVMNKNEGWWPEGPADDRPMNRVSWFDAVTFCNMLSERAGLKPCYRIEGEKVAWVGSEGYRLPTEAEWEYACRAGSQTRWYFGNDESEIGEYAWYNANANAPQPVGLKRSNAWGLHDMHGNVWEWCWDWDAAYPARTSALLVNPRGPGEGSLRVLRGGSVDYRAEHMRSADRLANWPADRGRNWGFRCVRSIARPEETGADALALASIWRGWDNEVVSDPTGNGVFTEEAPARSFVEPTTGIRFLWIQGGAFMMGADDIGDSCAPSHRVQVSPFWLAETPVTNHQYAVFLRSTQAEEPRFWRDSQFNQPEQPVVGVSWREARTFCRWLNLFSPGYVIDLPTEAQWEFAARGEEDRKYPWGDEEPDESRGWFGKDSKTNGSLPVGSLPAGRGPFQHLDLAGNVWEWCQDVWDTHAYRERDLLTIDPRGPGALEEDLSVVRACRGGAFISGAPSLRAAFRHGLRAGGGLRVLGFRVAALPTSR